MAWTTRMLVVANQTLESAELRDYLRARAAQGPLRLTIVVPAGHWERDSAQERLDRTLQVLREDGIEAEGALGDSEPCGAALDVFDPRAHDEIVVSTLPNATSQWLLIDLPHRLRRATDAQVHHVAASEPRPALEARAPAQGRPRPAWFERLFPTRTARS